MAGMAEATVQRLRMKHFLLPTQAGAGEMGPIPIDAMAEDIGGAGSHDWNWCAVDVVPFFFVCSRYKRAARGQPLSQAIRVWPDPYVDRLNP